MSSTTTTASSARPLALAMRRDLIVKRQRWQGREYWTIKDPLTLTYYRFEEEEFTVLSLLDGQTSSEQIQGEFERRFPPQRLTARQLQHLLTQLHRSNLLVADAAGQGEQLLARDRTKRHRQRLAALGNFLAIRVRGFDPDPLLTALDRRVGWIFSAPAALAACALILAALLLVAAEYDTFLARLPTLETFFAARNWLWLAATLSVTKVLHEFGHGLACKRFGGECREMGVMLLVGSPCLYCNVSDAWIIPSNWRRAAIGAAGMYVELILASLCTFLWWFSEPGLLNQLCLNVMFVSSVSTLLFNANPLMKFDGYYILADLIEIPNLRQKSAAIIQRKLGAWLLGLRQRPDPFLPARGRWLFAAYSLASAFYGWLVALSIFWFIYQVLEPYGLKILGQMLAVAMIASLIVMPLVRLFHFLLEPARAQTVNKMRATIGLGVVAAVLAMILAVPLPYYVAATFEVQPRDAACVYVDVPGELTTIEATRGAIAAGQTIAVLDDSEIRQAAERLQAQRGGLLVRIESIRQRAHIEDAALLELAQTEEALAALDQQIARLQQDLAKLTIRAPVAGVIVPPPARASEKGDRTRLVSWSGRPLEVRNVGAYLEPSTLLCQIAQPGQLEAILAIDQNELDFVRTGQPVDLLLASLPGHRLTGKIDRIAEEKMAAVPTRLTARGGGQLATKADAAGIERPLAVVYQANVPLDDPTGQIASGVTGAARIRAAWQPLASRLWRSFCRTFHFEL
jgi:putative peptide zinc metalloprotease protein